MVYILYIKTLPGLHHITGINLHNFLDGKFKFVLSAYVTCVSGKYITHIPPVIHVIPSRTAEHYYMLLRTASTFPKE